MTTENQIKKDMTIEEILSHFPQKGQKIAQAMQPKACTVLDAMPRHGNPRDGRFRSRGG